MKDECRPYVEFSTLPGDLSVNICFHFYFVTFSLERLERSFPGNAIYFF